MSNKVIRTNSENNVALPPARRFRLGLDEADRQALLCAYPEGGDVMAEMLGEHPRPHLAWQTLELILAFIFIFGTPFVFTSIMDGFFHGSGASDGGKWHGWAST